MEQVLSDISNILIVATIVLTMGALGFKLTTSQVLGAFKDWKVLLFALLGNMILVPIIVFALLAMSGLDSDIKTGILIMAILPGSSLTPKFVSMAKGNNAQGIALMISLIVVSTVSAPLTLALMPGDLASSFDPMTVLKSLILVQILPLAVALFVHARWPATAATLQPGFSKYSTDALLLAIVLIIGLNAESILSEGWGAIAIIVAVVVASFVIGWLLGGSSRATMAIATTEKNNGPALLVAAGVSAVAQTTVIVYAIVMIVGLILISSEIGKRRSDATSSGGATEQPAASS